MARHLSLLPLVPLLLMLSRGAEAIQGYSCDGKGQVIFIIDGSSGVMSAANFDNMKAAVIAVTSELGIEPTSGYRAGLIQYGLTTADGRWVDLLCCSTKQEVLSMMDTLTWQNSGVSALGKGLWKMNSRFTAANRGMGDTLTGVIITPSPAQDSVHAEIQAMRAKDLGIKLITVGVGANSPDNLLQDINTPGNFMKVASFEELNTATWTRRLLSFICQDTPDCSYKTQVQFVVDGSSAVGSDVNFGHMNEAIQAITSELVIDPVNNARVGMIQYGDTTADGPWVDLLCCSTLSEYIMQILRIRWQQSTNSELGKGLWKMFSRFEASDRGIGDSLVGIIITAGPAQDDAHAMQQAVKAKTRKGVTLITVGVGVNAPNTLLSSIASSSMHMEVDSYAELNTPQVIQTLIDYICN